MLSNEQLAAFERDGYLIVPNFFTKDDCTRLCDEARRLLGTLDLSTHPRTKFTTVEPVRRSPASHPTR